MRALVAALALVAAGPAQAQALAAFQPSTYLQLRLGLYAPQSSDLDGFSNGFALDGAFGYRFHPNLAAEADIGYFSSSASASVSGFTADAKVSDIPLTASLKAIAPLGAVDLHGLIGIGLHFATLEASVSGLGSASESATAFGFHLGAGLAFAVSPAVSLGLDLRYLFAKPDFAGVSVKIDGLLVNGALQYRF